MKELEICKSSICEKENTNVWTLYNKKAHRSNNRKATYQELKKALDDWTNTETLKPQCELYFYHINGGSEHLFLRKTLLNGESIKNKKIICLMGQDWKGEYLTTGECEWNKIIFYDSEEKQYYLRSFAKQDKRTYDNKELDQSQIRGWYIDFSTLNAPAEFWDYLKDIFKKEGLDTPKLHTECDFWINLNHVQTRKELLEILKENLTDEEILYLCEKI